MLAYVIRRIAYAVPILIGVNLITFFLFFYVYNYINIYFRKVL